MLDLESPRWGELMHAHGPAADLPALLERLRTQLSEEIASDQDEAASPLASTWFELSTAICPGGEASSASYAAVPHIVALAATCEVEVRAQLLQLVARVEAGRHRPGAPAIPDDLEPAYRASLSRVPHLVTARLGDEWDPTTAQVMAGILLVAKGHPQLGMAVMNLSDELQCPACGTLFPVRDWEPADDEDDF